MKRMEYTSPQINQAQINEIALKIDMLAKASLLTEVSLENKPGLVCPSRHECHPDMNFELFQISIQSLTGYFADMVQLGYQQVTFESLQKRGIQAEMMMLEHTKGINTHRGAIFNFGFICAAIGRCLLESRAITAQQISNTIIHVWQHDLLYLLPRNEQSHGQKMRKKYGITGAIEEVASGFQSVLAYALPCLKKYIKWETKEKAYLQTLLCLIAHIQDSNLVWRGGIDQLYYVQNRVQHFLSDGGMYQLEAEHWLQELNTYFITHQLSAGGSADLLGVTLFLHEVESYVYSHHF